MTDTTSDTPGSDAPGAAARRPSEPKVERSREVATAFERKAYAAATSRGYGNAMGRGFELAVTLLVMVGIGWLADRALGTAPLMVVVFSVLGFAGIGVKLKLGYDLEMESIEKDAIWNRKRGAAS